MFSCAVRTPPEHTWRSNTKQRHNVEMTLIVPLFNIRHNSYFFSRYYCAKSNIKCPKIVKNTLIIDTFSPVYMGFLAYRAQYYLILSIALYTVHTLSLHTRYLSSYLSRRLKTAQHATTNNQPYQSM